MTGGKPDNTLPMQELLELLEHGEMGECSLTPQGSNYTFFSTLTDGSRGECQVVYKPCRGEAPLRDFPPRTLYQREYAAYLLSEALGWGLVPPTVVRNGQYGVGSVQLFVDADLKANYFTLRDTYRNQCLRICTFDVVANNADRKGSHCLLDGMGHIWAIDHGVTFHTQHKLRTVIWDFIGEPIPKELLNDMCTLQKRLGEPGGLRENLMAVLALEEVDALQDRVSTLLEQPVFPSPGLERPIPWPWL
jgi:uncharacterized repeat protein (TIGR03843 family)